MSHINKTKENELSWKDKSSKNCEQHLTKEDCTVTAIVHCCETSGLLITPPGTPDRVSIVCFMPYTRRTSLQGVPKKISMKCLNSDLVHYFNWQFLKISLDMVLLKPHHEVQRNFQTCEI